MGQRELFIGEDSAQPESLGQKVRDIWKISLLWFIPSCEGGIVGAVDKLFPVISALCMCVCVCVCMCVYTCVFACVCVDMCRYGNWTPWRLLMYSSVREPVSTH